MPVMTNRREQAVTGLVPPELDEATIRVVWPSVAATPAAASLGRALMRGIVTAPLGWLLLAPLYFKKVVPILGRRYTLTNRRVMIQKAMQPQAVAEVPLSDIDEVQIKTDANSAFYRAATLEIVSKGRVVFALPGVPNPEAFRHAILNASMAWVPGKADTGHFIPASAATKAAAK
jgi:Bacterial PH domain